MNRVMKTSGWMLALAVVGIHCTAYAGRTTTRNGYLGVSIEKLTFDDKKNLHSDFGVMVVDVADKSPAEKAGIREDDVIQYYNDIQIRKTEDLTRRVRETKPGTTVKIVLVRDSKRTEVEAEIGRMKRSAWFSGAINGKEFQFCNRSRCYLGVKPQDLNADLAGYFNVKEHEGILVAEVVENGPAEKAGIKAGDVIVQLDNKKTTEPDDIQSILSDKEDGDKVEIAFVRKGERKTVTAELEERESQFNFSGPDVHVNIPKMPRINVRIPEIETCAPEINIESEPIGSKIPDINARMPNRCQPDLKMNVDEDYRDFMKKQQQAEERNQKGLAALRTTG
jgi:membrane-associated protease RseP (regulator of RpoE activity)